MTVSLRVVSAGQGYAYLLRSVVTGDGNAPQASAFTRYFTETGTPPGVWLGRGVEHLGDGALKPGMAVTPAQLQALLGHGVDPVTGEPLGRPFREYPTAKDRAARRAVGVDRSLPGEAFDAEVARIVAQEAARGSQTATAGFDLTFSVPKSVSVLWGLADATTQELIVAAHHDAVAQVLDFLEREVAATRTGHGGVAQVPVVGVAATAYDHWDSRANDPQLHTHLVISNKVKAVHDGQWRTLDSRALHHAVVALSEHYNAVLADRLTNTFGIGWERRERGADRSAQWEIVGVPDELLTEFSSRSRHIDIATDRLIADYATAHVRRPSPRAIVKLRAQATLATRPEKSIHSLADLTAGWRRRAERLIRRDPTGWARDRTVGATVRSLTADAVPLDVVEQVAAEVVANVSQKRSTWQHWNLWAEASRRTMHLRFVTAEDREQAVAMITDAATRRSVQLTPAGLASTPAAMRRPDGTSTLRPRHSEKFTSHELLAMEDGLLDLADDAGGQVVERTTGAHVVAGRTPDGVRLDAEQARAVAQLLTSGRRLDLLVGPAGTGKTTAMRALAAGWIATHGQGSVVGMAPSAAAAQVLAHDLQIPCDNTAKWIYDHCGGRTDFAPGQLVILDEATLASTRALDTITARAARVGAKVVLVGDPAQLQSVDAGGAFAMLVSARGEGAPRLTEVHRFAHDWEKTASLRLRDGDSAVIDQYVAHGRLREGRGDEMVDAAYAAWRHDVGTGRASILVTEAAETVRRLNDRARAERIGLGLTSAGRDVALNDDTHVSAGDVIITRRNDRRLRTGPTGWVRNGDRWTVTHVRLDGGLEVRPERRRGSVILPAGYVAEHVDLGYAVTAHRAQGLTVDTAHVVVSPSSTRENLYVSMTRGRQTNTAYVALDRPDPLHATAPDPDVTARSVLFGVLHHTGAEASAHQVTESEQNRWSSIAQIAAEYEAIATAAQQDRWTRLVRHALRDAGGLGRADTDKAVHSEAFGVLAAELRRAEALGHVVDELLPCLVARRGLLDADDLAAVLTSRLLRATKSPASGASPDLIAGLIPGARGPLPDDVVSALDERRRLIEARARVLATTAVEKRTSWVRRVSSAPTRMHERERWLADLTVIAAYRDLHGIRDSMPLGASDVPTSQARDRQLAGHALRRAGTIGGGRGQRSRDMSRSGGAAPPSP